MSKGLGSRILELLCLWLIYHVPIPLFFQHHVVLGHSAQIGNGWDLASPANVKRKRKILLNLFTCFDICG